MNSDSNICHWLQFLPKTAGGLSRLSAAEERNEVPDEAAEAVAELEETDAARFKYRHNHPYRRLPRPGDFGARRSTTTTPAPATTTTATTTTRKADEHYHSNFGYQPVETETESPKDASGPFVTVPHNNLDKKENVTNIARQPKKADDFGSGSNLHEIRVLPPEEFHHLLAKVDGVDRKVCFIIIYELMKSFHMPAHCSMLWYGIINFPSFCNLLQDKQGAGDSLPSESRRRSRKPKFQGVPGTAGRDFPTLGSIPMTRFLFWF